ncbi:MAG: DUF3127 domain-containing protein [Kiritimatiellae bacterium]|jgi:hypothetical protein|nr:DUF3127 domain-containing protein [Kiritimatiellia bacterium]
MATFEMDCVVVKIMDTETFPSGFSKRNIVVKTEERYPQDILVEFLKDNAKLVEPLKEGTRIKLSFDLRGREYNGRYFVSVTGWKVANLDAVEGAEQDASTSEPVASVLPPEVDIEDDENLPF